MTEVVSLQQTYAGQSTCYGCGPANEQGLQIKSFYDAETRVTRAEYLGQPHQEAFGGFLNGGIVSTLLDCHCNWAALAHAMEELKLQELPCTVTAKLEVSFLAPTPATESIELQASVTETDGNKYWVAGAVLFGGKKTATCTACFVAVKPGHPAYHRWS